MLIIIIGYFSFFRKMFVFFRMQLDIKNLTHQSSLDLGNERRFSEGLTEGSCDDVSDVKNTTKC